MADDRLAALEADVTALRAAYHVLLGRTATLEAVAGERAGDADLLRALREDVVSLRTSVRLVGGLLAAVVLPVAVRLLLGGGL